MLKRMRFLLVSAVILSSFVGAVDAGPFDILGPVSYKDAVHDAAPAVVAITTTKTMPMNLHPMFQDPFFRQFFGDVLPQQRREQPGLGSGVIVDKRGYIVTNHHVIKDASSVMVSLPDGRESPAKLVGTDPESDVAILKIDLKELPVIHLGNDEAAEVGDVVLAIGNPFGVGQTVTQGIVSAKGRADLGINLYENFIQTDAAINPGNSGGALVDANGRLIGINTAIFSRSGGSHGIGFAIPASIVEDVLEQLIKTGQVVRGWLGVRVQSLTQHLKRSFGYDESYGLLVAQVVAQGPAHQAGLQPGDIIMRLNETKISSPQTLFRTSSAMKPGNKYPLHVFRNGKTVELTLVAGKRPVSAR